jgi:hypothetical protein
MSVDVERIKIDSDIRCTEVERARMCRIAGGVA